MLTTLPNDIIFNILSCLSTTSVIRNHPYLTLTLVCKRLHTAVEDYTHHLLRSLSRRFPATAPVFPPQIVCNRRIYLHHASTHCFFCDAPIFRVARVDPDIRCCADCDDTVFGNTISGEYAEVLYGVSQLELRRHCAHKTVLNRWGFEGYVFGQREVRRYVERVQAGLEQCSGVRSRNWVNVFSELKAKEDE
jgi:ribosomal protein L37AE/L43A